MGPTGRRSHARTAGPIPGSSMANRAAALDLVSATEAGVAC